MHKPIKNGSLKNKFKRWFVFNIEDDLTQRKLTTALNKIVEKLTINHDYDIPYLAGYSKNAKIIYIDKHLPKYMLYKNKKINIHRFLALHEIVEKTLIDQLKPIQYREAHQIALRTEQAAVEGENISWRAYKKFLQQYIDAVLNKKSYDVPKNLDLKPYLDEDDQLSLRRMNIFKKTTGKKK